MFTLDISLLILGLGLLLNPLIASLAQKTPLTPALVYLSLGALLGASSSIFPGFSMAYANQDAKLIEHFTEVVVVITLAGAGLKIDRPFDKLWWSSTWRLLGITMPLSIAGITALGWVWGLPFASALLLGSVLAPTDPVLAHDMQTGPPQQDTPEKEAKIVLTTEAGFNDGLAFPFTYLAIALHYASNTASGTVSTSTVFFKWLQWDLLGRVGLGLGMGWLMGRLLSWILFKATKDHHKKDTMNQHFGVFIIGATLATYACAELVGGYGFLAVFIAATVGRSQNREEHYHRKTFKFLEQIEESLTSVLLLILGVFFAYQGKNLWQAAYWGSAVIIVVGIRPLAGMIGLWGYSKPLKKRLAIAFLGVRGIGSFYYLAYAAHHFKDDEISEITLLVLCCVVVSAVLHGLSSKKLLST